MEKEQHREIITQPQDIAGSRGVKTPNRPVLVKVKWKNHSKEISLFFQYIHLTLIVCSLLAFYPHGVSTLVLIENIIWVDSFGNEMFSRLNDLTRNATERKKYKS